MKKKILLFTATTLFVVAIFTACKKDSNNSSNNANTEASVQSDDQNQVSSASEATANDADVALEASPSFTGRLNHAQTVTVCNATAVIDSVSDPRTITLTYNGADCFGATTRTGSVVISMAQGVHWKDQGAAVTITFQNLKITRLSDNKSITLSGSQTYTNVSGGLLIDLASLGTVTHTLTSSGLTITFDDNTQRTWQVAEQRAFTYDGGAVITVSGTHTDGTNVNIAEWGVNRLGHSFTSSTVEPLVIRQDCNFRIVSGEIKHVTSLVTVTTTFGLDVNGNSTACPGSGHYYMKIIWEGAGGNSLTAILGY